MFCTHASQQASQGIDSFNVAGQGNGVPRTVSIQGERVLCAAVNLYLNLHAQTNLFEYTPLQLLQLDDEFGFLSDQNTTRVVDLCACPGTSARARAFTR